MLLLGGVLTIALVLVVLMSQFFVVPMYKESVRNAERAAQELKIKDDNILLPPKGDDLKIVGKWCDAIQYTWTGKVADVVEFKADGTYIQNTGSSSATKGTWGRLKGNNRLVTRYAGMTTDGTDLRFDSSGTKLSVNSIYHIRVP
nr:hypothetical protein [uncultured Methanoregula sp.]